MIPHDHNYKVSIPLLPPGRYGIKERISEIQKISDCLDSIVDWIPDQYSMNIHSSGTILDVWFKEDRHAMMCALGWL